jgi:Holliday junction resolvasome RuvABC endonuclease subunit
MRTVNGATIKKLKILAIDPSIRGWGWAVVEGRGNVLDYGCVRTEKLAGKVKNLRAGDDFARRVFEISSVLKDVIDEFHVDYMVSELPHGSQSFNSAKMVGMVPGQLVTASVFSDIPLEWFSEADSKRNLLRKTEASKLETINAIVQLYDVPCKGKSKPKAPFSGFEYIDQAVADALSVHYCAIKTSPTIKYLIKSNL